MAEGASRAILLVCIMLLSGCIRGTVNDGLIDNTERFSFSSKWAEIDEQIIVVELTTSVLVLSDQSVPWNYELTITTNIGKYAYSISERQDNQITISFKHRLQAAHHYIRCESNQPNNISKGF